MPSKKTSKKQQEIPITIKPRRNSLFTTITIVVFLLLLVSIISGCTSLLLPEEETGNVAVIPIHGIIAPSSSSNTFNEMTAKSSTIVKLIEEADENAEIKAIVLDINSGGGAPVASAEIAQAIDDAKKPTIAWIRDVGASGAYWIASATDTIVAHELSTTGSIGVTGSYIEFSGLLNDYNVTYNRQVSGYYKDMGTPLKEMTPSEERIFQDLLGQMHDVFIRQVAANRNMSVEQVDELADGRVYLGLEAKENGLVDALGSKNEVQTIVASYINETVAFRNFYPKQSFLDVLPSISAGFAQNIGKGMGEQLTETSAAQQRPRI
ncbi:MAG: signal peptide peptidase SppA [Nanobdellota archaeon]